MFEPKQPQSGFGTITQPDALPLPEGQNLSKDLIQTLSELPTELGLSRLGVVTPWATYQDGGEWDEVVSPAESLQLYPITVQQTQQAFNKLYGQPIPYLGLLLRSLHTQTEIVSALEGTDYELYDTQAVYSQADSQHVPNIAFFCWISVRALGTRKTKSLAEVVAKLRAALVFAERVPYLPSARREHPSIGFMRALNTRASLRGLGTEAAAEVTIPVETTEDPIIDLKSLPIVQVCVGILAASLTYMVARSIHK